MNGPAAEQILRALRDASITAHTVMASPDPGVVLVVLEAGMAQEDAAVQLLRGLPAVTAASVSPASRAFVEVTLAT